MVRCRNPSPQTFTKPFRQEHIHHTPGEFPLDDSFRDTRVAISADWEQPLGRLYAMNVGVSASAEFDYLHLGLNAKLSRDFNNRNTTLSGGFAFASDQLDPVGGVPDPLTPMRNVRDDDDDDDDGNGGRASNDSRKSWTSCWVSHKSCREISSCSSITHTVIRVDT